MASDPEIPRFLLIALAQAQRAFARHDRTAFGTINEYVQPVADAALSWICDIERERDEARAETTRLREVLTALVTDCADTPVRDSRHYVAARAALDKALTERDEARTKLTATTDIAQLTREVERLSRRVEVLEASALPEGWEPSSLAKPGRRSLSICHDAATGNYVLWDSAAEGGSRCVGRGATMRAAVEDWQRRGGR